ncbi:hypothetical protein C0989_006842, partial [Termitomyces sp. Mn162]
MATRTKTQTARVTRSNAQQAALGPEGRDRDGPEGLAESGGVVNQNDDPEQRRVRTDVGYGTPPGRNTNDLPNVGSYRNRNMSGDADGMSSESNDVASVTKYGLSPAKWNNAYETPTQGGRARSASLGASPRYGAGNEDREQLIAEARRVVE